MTLEQANTADKCLIKIYETPLINSPYLLRGEIYHSLNFLDNHIEKEKYLSLLISDSYILVEDDHNPENRRYSITDQGKAFILFKGGYVKMIMDFKNKRSEDKLKYRFDIGKDIVLIILVLGTLVMNFLFS